MSTPDPEAVARGTAAINTRLARMSPEQRKAMTDAAREAQRRKIEDIVDPEGKYSPEERERLVNYEVKARLAKMQLAKIRAAKARAADADQAALGALADADES